MALSIRPATASDLLEMQNTNLWCLPENYQLKYYYYHYVTCPQLLYVAEDYKGRIVGYVLAKMEEDTTVSHGHITSLAVRRTHRKVGLATRLMKNSQGCMRDVMDSEYVSLHVRESNRAAFRLYNETLGYIKFDVERGYYADGEDAYDMRMPFKQESNLGNGKTPRDFLDDEGMARMFPGYEPPAKATANGGGAGADADPDGGGAGPGGGEGAADAQLAASMARLEVAN